MTRLLCRVGTFVAIFFSVLTMWKLFADNDSLARTYLQQLIKLNQMGSVVDNPLELLNVNIYPEVKNFKMKDWHDYAFMDYEASRKGPGENGTAVVLTDEEEIKISDALREVEGLNVHVSDKISLQRSLPDVRHVQ